MGKIVIRTVERPDYKEPQQVIRWFCVVFGFSNTPEDDNVEEEMLEKFARAAHANRGYSSAELKFTKKMARSTVIYHLNRFMEVGLIVKRGRKYYLRATEMSKTIEEIEYDIDREMSKMLDAARQFDRLIGKKTKSPRRLGSGKDGR